MFIDHSGSIQYLILVAKIAFFQYTTEENVSLEDRCCYNGYDYVENSTTEGIFAQFIDTRIRRRANTESGVWKMEAKGNHNDAKWDNFEEMKEAGTLFTVTVEESVKAGVVTEVKGVRAFIPASQISSNYVEDVNEWIGKDIEVVVITAEREKNRLVLSGREAAKIRRRLDKENRIASLQIGSVLEGKVETVKPYGAFVDLGDGISGLVHISQLSSKRVASPEEVVKEGDTVKVKITRINDGKVSLSMRAVEEDAVAAQEAEEKVDVNKFVSHENVGTSLGDLLKDLKFD